MTLQDSIYHQVKFVLTINCICGLFSVKNCFGDSCEKLKFQLLSWQHLYSLALVVFSLTITIIVSGSLDRYHFRRLNVTIQSEYLMWVCLMHYTNRIYIKVLSKVQLVYNKQKDLPVKSTSLWIYILYLLHLFTYSCGIYLRNINASDRKWIESLVEFCFSYMISVRTFATLPYIATSNTIGEIFNSITTDLKHKLSHGERICNKTLIEIEKCRMLHLKLCFTTENFISCFSLPITLFFGLAYFDMLIKVGSIVDNKNFDTLIDPMILTITAILGYLIISASEELFQASQSISNVIRDLPLSNKSHKFYIHLKQFSLQIKSTAIKVSAGNYFLLRKRTFPGIVGSMTSFLVVVVQLIPHYNNLYGFIPESDNTTDSKCN